MRNITECAAYAFAHAERFKRDNTIVIHGSVTVEMHLHGHVIATRRKDVPDIFVISMCGWATPTTRERLNGIMPDGLGIFQHKGKQYWHCENGKWTSLSGLELDPHAAYIINTATKTVEKFNG